MPLQTGVQYGDHDPPATGGPKAILWVNNSTGAVWLCRNGVYINITYNYQSLHIRAIPVFIELLNSGRSKIL